MSFIKVIRFIIIAEVARQGVRKLFSTDIVPKNIKRVKDLLFKGNKLKFKSISMNIFDYYINYKVLTNKEIKDRLKSLYSFNGDHLLHSTQDEKKYDIQDLPKEMTLYVIVKSTGEHIGEIKLRNSFIAKEGLGRVWIDIKIDKILSMKKMNNG
jgi:hypothetical protein